MRTKLLPMLFGLMVFVLGQWAFAQQSPNPIKKLSLEELMDLDVTSVSRRSESLSRSAAAIAVLTSEDLRRLGATNIPEALRLVPGIQVARSSAGGWAISARGFTNSAANKLLVLIDGRPVYSPIFSGVFWDIQDLVIDDVARIEVVRGPGATLWGTNAVNGVINIITKSSHQTRGGLAVVSGGGATDLAQAALRIGGGTSPDISYRGFAKYFYRDESKLANGDDGDDASRLLRAGFRTDAEMDSGNWTVMGDVYSGLNGIRTRENAKVLGGYILARWTKSISTDSEIQIQTYVERNYRRVPLQSDFNQRTVDFDLQHQFKMDRHNVIWGAEYRWNKDTSKTTPVLSFEPMERTYPLATAFLQDEISFANDAIRVLVGSKFEHNDFTGFEFQPSIRMNWLLRPDETLWAALSRAVRTPTRFDSDLRFSPPGLNIIGNPNFESEDLTALEFGYRARPYNRLSVDLATFYNIYDELRSLEVGPPPPTGRVDLLNNLTADTYGAEFAFTFDVTEFWRFTSGYSYLHRNLKMEPGRIDLFGGTLEGNDPKHQFFLRQTADLPRSYEFDWTLRFVDNLPNPPVPQYMELDARIGWTPTGNLELSIIGQNLFDNAHPEFNGPSPFRSEVLRNIQGRLMIRF